MDNKYSHFSDLIHRVEHEIFSIIQDTFSKLPSSQKKLYPNQWIHLVWLLKYNHLKEFNELYKNDILLLIQGQLNKIVTQDSFIKKLSILYVKKEDAFDMRSEIENEVTPYTKLDYQNAVFFSYDYQINTFTGEHVDLLREFQDAYWLAFSESENKLITNELIIFRNERDWEQFHNPKDLALAINIEAAELLELFLWKKADEANTEKVKEELADIFSFAFLLAEKYGFDVKEIVLNKMKLNGEKYPVDKSKGTAKKYDEL